jgi:uncharacterized repeat protein (TIGR01451 family)
MSGKENNAILPMVIVPHHLRRPALRLFGLMLGVGLLVFLFVFLLGNSTSVTQAALLLSHLILSHVPQGSCDEPGNLAPNPGFECAGASPGEPADWTYDTWEGSPAIFFRSDQLHHSGDYSVFIGSGSTESKSRWRSRPLDARPDRIYEFSVWVNADQLSNKATVSLTFWSGWPSGDTILKVVDAEGTGDTSGDWVHLVSSYMAPPGTRYIRLECRLYGAGTVWFDDAAIREYIEEPVLDLVQSDAPDPVYPPGQSLTYTLVYSNTGNSTATNVVITDTFDARVHFTGSVPAPTGGSGQVRFWRLSSLPVDGPHQIVITTTVEPFLPDYSVLLNQVEWRSAQTSTRRNVELTVVRNVPVLEIVKIDTTDPVTAGERLTYTITYTNSGTAPMTGISLVECYPAPTVFITATPAPTNPAINNLWHMPDLVPGGIQSVTVVLSVSVSAADGTVFNNVSLISNEVARSVEESTTIKGRPKPAISMTLSPKCPDIRVEAGETAMLRYQLNNAGGQVLTNISITPTMPQSWKGSIQIEPTGLVSLCIGCYQPVTLTVRPAADEISGTYTTQITATSSETSTHAMASVKVPRYWSVVVEPDNKHSAPPCDQVTFTHWITNLGNFTDTIVVNVFTSTSWSVSPTLPVTLTNVGIGKRRLFTVTVGVPCEARESDVGGVMVLATSATGRAQDPAFDFVVVGKPPRDRQVFLPVVMKSYRGPDPFCNGDFKEPLEPCWEVKSPPVERKCDGGGCCVRLGTAADDDNARCKGGLIAHTTELVQTFTPTATGVLVLSFEYQVHTQDVLSDIFDTLEAYVDATRVLLVVRGHYPYGCNVAPLVVTDTKQVSIPVVNGVPVTLKFRLLNRDTWFNTYADICNVRVTYP